MGKFANRLRKTKKHAEHCLVLGNAFGNLEEILLFFSAVFVINEISSKIRTKKIIYKENFKETYGLPNIDFVFIDFDQLDRLSDVQDILVKFRPLIYIGHGEFLDKKYGSFLGKLGFEIVEINKKYQVWQTKGLRK